MTRGVVLPTWSTDLDFQDFNPPPPATQGQDRVVLLVRRLINKKRQQTN